jgi:hypothetical protein
VELVELHVGDGGSGAVGHGDAVSRGDSGVGGVGVDLTGPSAGEEGSVSVDSEDASFAVEESGSGDAIVFKEEVDAGGPLREADVGESADVAEERDGDLLAGGVAVGVEDARAGVGAFAGEHQFAVLAVEGGSPCEEFFDALRALFDEDMSGIRVDEAVAGGEGVFVVEGDVFVSAESDGDSALRVGGVGFGEFFLGDNEDGAIASETRGRAEAGDSGADDEKINLLVCLIGGGVLDGRSC